MKVCFVSENFFPNVGGVPDHLVQLQRELRGRGHQVCILTPRHVFHRYGDQVARHGLIFVGTSLRVFSNGSFADTSAGFFIATKLKRVLRRERFDVVHIHSPLFPTLPLLVQKVTNTTTVATLHTNFEGSWWFGVFREQLQRYIERLDGIISVSEVAARALERYFHFGYTVIPNGVDPELFARAAAADLHPINRRGRRRLLFVGRFDPRNGPLTLLEAFGELAHRYPDLELHFVGDGPLRATVEQAVPEALRPRVVFRGYLLGEDKAAAFRAATVFCSPATIASFGITLLEALAAGTAVVCSDIDGFREVIRPEETALCAPPREPHAWARQIDRLLGEPVLRERMVAAGRAAVQRYAWPRVAGEIEAFYEAARERRARRLGQAGRGRESERDGARCEQAMERPGCDTSLATTGLAATG